MLSNDRHPTPTVVRVRSDKKERHMAWCGLSLWGGGNKISALCLWGGGNKISALFKEPQATEQV